MTTPTAMLRKVLRWFEQSNDGQEGCNYMNGDSDKYPGDGQADAEALEIELREFLARQAAAPQGREALSQHDVALIVEALNMAASRKESQAEYVKHGRHHDEKAKRMRELRSVIVALSLTPAVAPDGGAGEAHPFQQCEKCWQPATCKKYGCREDALAQAQEPGEDDVTDSSGDVFKDLNVAPPQVDSGRGPTAEDIYACAETTLIGFRDELTEDQIKFICDQISRKAVLQVDSGREAREKEITRSGGRA